MFKIFLLLNYKHKIIEVEMMDKNQNQTKKVSNKKTNNLTTEDKEYIASVMEEYNKELPKEDIYPDSVIISVNPEIVPENFTQEIVPENVGENLTPPENVEENPPKKTSVKKPRVKKAKVLTEEQLKNKIEGDKIINERLQLSTAEPMNAIIKEVDTTLLKTYILLLQARPYFDLIMNRYEYQPNENYANKTKRRTFVGTKQDCRRAFELLSATDKLNKLYELNNGSLFEEEMDKLPVKFASLQEVFDYIDSFELPVNNKSKKNSVKKTLLYPRTQPLHNSPPLNTTEYNHLLEKSDKDYEEPEKTYKHPTSPDVDNDLDLTSCL